MGARRRERARALAAIRETYEETGLVIGEPHTPTLKSRSPQGSGELLDLHWVGLSRAQQMEQLPHITRSVLQELERRLRAGAGPEVCGPISFTRYGKSVIDSI